LGAAAQSVDGQDMAQHVPCICCLDPNLGLVRGSGNAHIYQVLKDP